MEIGTKSPVKEMNVNFVPGLKKIEIFETPKKVLVVDDCYATRAMIGVVLKIHGLPYLEATSGVEAMRFLDQNDSIGVVLLDLNMPEGSGIEFLGRVRLHSVHFDIPVCVVSGSSQPSVIHLALDSGADDYLIKGVDQSIMIHKLKRLLQEGDADDPQFFHAYSDIQGSLTAQDEAVSVTVTKISEVEFHIETKNKLPYMPMRLSAPFFDNVFHEDSTEIWIKPIFNSDRYGRTITCCEVIGLPERKLVLLREVVSRGKFISDPVVMKTR